MSPHYCHAGTEVCASGDQLAAILSAQAGAPMMEGSSEAPASAPAREDADAATSSTLSDNAPITNTTPQAAAGASPIEQSNSTGQASGADAREAPDGSSAPRAVSADTITSTTSNSPTRGAKARHLFRSNRPLAMPQRKKALEIKHKSFRNNHRQQNHHPLPPAANDNSPRSDEQLATGTE